MMMKIKLKMKKKIDHKDTKLIDLGVDSETNIWNVMCVSV